MSAGLRFGKAGQAWRRQREGTQRCRATPGRAYDGESYVSAFHYNLKKITLKKKAILCKILLWSPRGVIEVPHSHSHGALTTMAT